MSDLLLLVLFPFALAFFFLLMGAFALPSKFLKRFALALSLAPLVLFAYGLGHWEGSDVFFPWIPSLGIDFHLALDGLSLIFIFLTLLIIPIAIVAVRAEVSLSFLYYALIFLLQGFLFILFSARDLALFIIAWEAILLPLYFIISLWGGLQRQNAAITFLVYMIAGSAFLVAAALALYFAAPTPTFDFSVLAASASENPYAPWIFAIFLLAFAVKTPLFPFHAWLPHTYTQAPFAGTILLAALLSKAGIYGIARIGYDLFPSLIAFYRPYLLSLAVVGSLYGAITAWTQNDYKRLIAYSSFSHVNMILVGLFVGGEVALQGSILQAFNHGITIAALFLVAAWLKQRIATTEIGDMSGVAKYFPVLCWVTLFFVLAAIALPGTNNFVGEFIIFYALFKEHPWTAAVLVTTVILSALYMLRWMQTVYFGEPFKLQSIWPDIGKKELWVALSLAAIILAVGIYPKPMLDTIRDWKSIRAD